MAIVTFPDEIYELYRGLLSVLPPGTATLARQPSQDTAGGEDIVVIPANPNSAKIDLHPGGDIIYASIGRHTTMEFFVSSQQREKQELESLRKISRAVIKGKFSEDVWSVKGKIVKSRGTFEIDGRTQTMGGFLTFFNPFRRKQKEHYDYSPYVQLCPGERGPTR